MRSEGPCAHEGSERPQRALALMGFRCSGMSQQNQVPSSQGCPAPGLLMGIGVSSQHEAGRPHQPTLPFPRLDADRKGNKYPQVNSCPAALLSA
jgi:hypothetical protein